MDWPSRDITLMAGYSRVEPFGIRRHDLHAARTQAMIANAVSTMLAAMGSKRPRKTVQPSEFMHPRKKTESQKIAELKSGMSALAARGGSGE